MIIVMYKVSPIVIVMCCGEQVKGRVRIEDVCLLNLKWCVIGGMSSVLLQ